MNFREEIEKNDAEAIAAGIAAGADPNGHDDTLLPWVIVALRADAFKALDALLKAGANPEGPPGEALSPLMVAMRMNKAPAIDLLLRHGANPNRILAHHQTALHLASKNQSVVERLIAAGADLKIVDDQGRTPLMKAAAEGQLEVVRALLAAGSDPLAADLNSGQTAWQLAKRGGHQGVCDLLPAPPAPVQAALPPRASAPVKIVRAEGKPVETWQAIIVILVGLIVAALFYYKLWTMQQ